jgi:hypothetical protein
MGRTRLMEVEHDETPRKRLLSRIPPAWKRRLLPIWNGGHRLAWRLSEYLGAICHGRFGVCDVCGRFGPWLYRRRVVPPTLEERWGLTPRLAEALARKESNDCAWCGAKLRARRLAQVLLDLGGAPRARSITEWVKRPEVRALRVAEVNRIEGLHQVLSVLPYLATSDYSPRAGPGEIVNGVRSEDLTKLTYSDGSFDLVLTSESLEHVPDLAAALREIRRVLAPRGRHVFTIPLLPGVLKTFARTISNADGSLERRAPEICHPGGDVGYAVFTELGADFSEILRAAGFHVDIAFGPVSEDDLAQVYVCYKKENENELS